jgi:hypothetical protein
MFVYQPCQQRHLHYHWWETDQGSQRECFQGKQSQTGHFYLDFFGVWAWVHSQLIGQSCLKIEGKWKQLGWLFAVTIECNCIFGFFRLPVAGCGANFILRLTFNHSWYSAAVNITILICYWSKYFLFQTATA